jgi:acyl phosphate:glycerol-3-phosphate acyltransferase
MSGDVDLLIWAVCGYLFGSIPLGLVLARLAGYGDIRKIGSGNIGATNVLRTGNRPLAALTVLLDAGKGAIAALLAIWLADRDAAVVAGVAAVFGHIFPVWIGFRGGKGVATTLGAYLALAWPLGLAACVTWLVTAALFRISSLAALVSVILSPAFAWVFGDPMMVAATAAIGLAVIWRHQSNIARLFAGTEPRIGGGGKDTG